MRSTVKQRKWRLLHTKFENVVPLLGFAKTTSSFRRIRVTAASQSREKIPSNLAASPAPAGATDGTDELTIDLLRQCRRRML